VTTLSGSAVAVTVSVKPPKITVANNTPITRKLVIRSKTDRFKKQELTFIPLSKTFVHNKIYKYISGLPIA